MPRPFLKMLNSRTSASRDLPLLDAGLLHREVAKALNGGLRLLSFFGDRAKTSSRPKIYAILGDDESGRIFAAAAEISGSFPSLTPDYPQTHLFEREISEQYNVIFENHPWPKPVRTLPAEHTTESTASLFRLEGAGIHEVGVGPVHAGVIEPGHFRFQCVGETVLHLEIALGYQHRGIEGALRGGPYKKSLYQLEAVAGDTTIGHTLAYCQSLEALADCRVPPRARGLRSIALELERLANHTGDLGALAQDVAYLPTASYCGRIRGDFLNMTALLCGSRFGRGFIRPGGIGPDPDSTELAELNRRLVVARRDLEVAVTPLWQEPSVASWFEGAGRLTGDDALKLGLVGPAARACGVVRDVRIQYPSDGARSGRLPAIDARSREGEAGNIRPEAATQATGGDVYARALTRWREIGHSLDTIQRELEALPQGPCRSPCDRLKGERMVVTLVEGWRGEICHTAITDTQGRFRRYKIVDPSFHNWTGLAVALRNRPISEFPLNNKSFNLSYCGFDL